MAVLNFLFQVVKLSCRTQSVIKSPFTHQVQDIVKMSNNYIVTTLFWKLGKHSQTQVFRRNYINPEIALGVDWVGVAENFQKVREKLAKFKPRLCNRS